MCAQRIQTAVGAPDTSEQNEVAESSKNDLLRVDRSMLLGCQYLTGIELYKLYASSSLDYTVYALKQCLYELSSMVLISQHQKN